MASEQKQDTVAFVSVQKSYPPGEQLKIGYTLSQELKRSTRDWVGLFKVGWTSSRDYYTFEWAPALADEHLTGEVTFAGRRLPPEDNHFYQFCYVTSDGRVRGASPPFQFLAVSLARVDDLELVEIGEESLMILQPIKKKEDHDFMKLSTVNESLMCEKEELVKQLEEVEISHDKTLKEKDEVNAELERQLATKRESEQRLIEKLDRERAQNHELNTAKQQLEAANQELQATNQELEQRLSEKVERETTRNQELTAAIADTESQIITLTQQVTEKEAVNAALEAEITDLKRQAADKDASAKAEVAAVQAEVEEMKGQFAEKDAEFRAAMDRISAMQAEMDDLRGQLQIKNAQVEDLSQLASTRGEEKEQFSLEAEQLQGRLLEVQQIRADLIEQNEAKQERIDQLVGELTVQGEENSELVKEVEQLKQELACSQENVAELVGAGPNAVIVHQPVAAPANPDDPPTQPPTQDCIVDRAAYDALHQAYESLESNFHSTKDANKELTMKLQSAQIKIDEMVARLEQAKEEYEILAKENHELKKRGCTPVPPVPSDKPADRQIKEMESINKELVASCEVATQQLSARKEEMKQQLVRIEQLETELAQVNRELEQFQDKHDKIVHAKTESLDKQQAVLDEKLKELVECQQALQTSEKEKAKLEGIVRQLRGQLDSLKAVAGSSERTCPVCNTKFPGRMSQRDFETHVQGHF